MHRHWFNITEVVTLGFCSLGKVVLLIHSSEICHGSRLPFKQMFMHKLVKSQIKSYVILSIHMNHLSSWSFNFQNWIMILPPVTLYLCVMLEARLKQSPVTVSQFVLAWHLWCLEDIKKTGACIALMFWLRFASWHRGILGASASACDIPKLGPSSNHIIMELSNKIIE